MKHRLAVILPTYLVMYALVYHASFLLRFDFELPQRMAALFWASLPFVLLVKFGLCLATGEWRRSFRYATLVDVLFVALGATGAAVVVMAGTHVIDLAGPRIPRSVILIDWALTILSGNLLRSGSRFYTELFRSQFGQRKKERALIYRSDRTGIGILRAIQATGMKYRIVGFVDDWARDRVSLLAGLPVLPSSLGWKKLVRKSRAKHVLIPGTVPGKTVREILAHCSRVGLEAHVIPAVDEIVEGRYKLNIRDVTISDLLRRKPAELDMRSIRQCVTDRRVLVTGAAGSIGSELCRQILALKPRSLVLLDQSELGIFTVEQEFNGRLDTDCDIHYVIADVIDEDSIRRVMEKYRPELLFHAAAYKHVPLMEESPQEAIRNNVLGTKNVVDLADRFGVDRFVLISTDKAVFPSSVMGATKLLAEKYLQGMASVSATRFITVRFGNVLNSAGSVVPTFRRQIEAGGPITVTHPEMERFFMTIPEAVQLVLQAGAIGDSGDVLILDMGQPVKILDLARDMIFLSGLKYPDDIDIVFTGVRPGEKLSEELFYAGENGATKVHEKIYCASRRELGLVEVKWHLSQLAAANSGTKAEALKVLREIVSLYATDEETAACELQTAA